MSDALNAYFDAIIPVGADGYLHGMLGLGGHFDNGRYEFKDRIWESFHWPDERGDAIEWILESAQRGDTYVCPYLMRDRKRAKGNTVGDQLAHTDVDAVWILAPHDLSIALEILDELPVPHTASGERHNGCAVALRGVLGRSPWVTIDVSVATRELRRAVRLHCRDGVAAFPDGYGDHIEIARRNAAIERRPVSTELPLRRELQAFLAHLDGGPPPRSCAGDGAAIVRRIEELRALAGLDGERPA
jgi:predicted dehydrogenase